MTSAAHNTFDTAPRLPLGTGLALTLLSWLIPGAGFLAVGRVARGMALFVLIQTPFAMGVLMSGAVPPPVWTAGDLGFNIVNSLTFVCQLGNGGLSGVWLVGNLAGVPFFADRGQLPLFELASFCIMVSGALNYFTVCNFYDRHVAPKPEATS